MLNAAVHREWSEKIFPMQQLAWTQAGILSAREPRSKKLNTYYFVTSAIDPPDTVNTHSVNITAVAVGEFLRKGKKIRYRCDRNSTLGYVSKGKAVEHILAIPVHLEDGSIDLWSVERSGKTFKGLEITYANPIATAAQERTSSGKWHGR